MSLFAPAFPAKHKALALLGLSVSLFLAACSGNNAAHNSPDDVSTQSIGINSFLWRAALDATSFLPLTSADSVGGVILTDWYSAPSAPNERIKVTVYILGKRLRADGLRVSTFRQTRQGSDWVDASTAPKTARSLENAILVRARKLRISNVDAAENATR